MHVADSFVFSMFLIFTGAALIATLALFLRQSLLVAYIVLGILFGPWGLKLIANHEVIRQSGDVGIIFLLFLLGMQLHPQSLIHMLKRFLMIVLASSLVFAVFGYAIARTFHYGGPESVIIACAMMFSSTIVGLKLIPEEARRHKRTGEYLISVLLLQDLIAIIILLILHGMSEGNLTPGRLLYTVLSLPVLFFIAYFVEKFVLFQLIKYFRRVKEYEFLLFIAWCLGMSQLACFLGLSEGIGAFVAGITIAAYPIAERSVKQLAPLRDFFLILFFFSIGAQFNYHYLSQIWLPVLILVVVMTFLKPTTFRLFLYQVNEHKRIAWEVGIRLSQVREFSLLIAYMALQTRFITPSASYLIQTVVVLTFIISSCLVMLRYKTPLTEELPEEASNS